MARHSPHHPQKQCAHVFNFPRLAPSAASSGMRRSLSICGSRSASIMRAKPVSVSTELPMRLLAKPDNQRSNGVPSGAM